MWNVFFSCQYIIVSGTLEPAGPTLWEKHFVSWNKETLNAIHVTDAYLDMTFPHDARA